MEYYKKPEPIRCRICGRVLSEYAEMHNYVSPYAGEPLCADCALDEIECFRDRCIERGRVWYFIELFAEIYDAE